MATEEVTETDRNLFRDRFKAAIKAAGSTAKGIEVELDLPKGTFLKIYKGLAPLTVEILESAAQKLGVEAAILVADTGFSTLIPQEPQPVPDSAAESITEIEDDQPAGLETPTEIEDDDLPESPESPEEYDSVTTDHGSDDRDLSPIKATESMDAEDGDDTDERDGPVEEAPEQSTPKATPPPAPQSTDPVPPPAPPDEEPVPQGLFAKLMSAITGIFS